MRPKEYMMMYRQIDKRIADMTEERRNLFDLATKVTPSANGGGSAPSGNSDKTGRIVSKIADLDAEISTELERLVDIKTDIMRQISEIENLTYRNILTMYYLKKKPPEERRDNEYSGYYSLEDVANAVGYSFRQIARLHGLALEEIKVPEFLKMS